MSRRSSRSSARRPGRVRRAPTRGVRGAGFTLVELLVAAAILGILVGGLTQVLTRSLLTRRSETQRIDLQQNVRAAMQLIAQDARASAVLHVYNLDDCDDPPGCSDDDEVTLVTTEGDLTQLAEPPGDPFQDSTVTRVCEVGGFAVGDQALFVNQPDQAALVEVTQVIERPGPCQTDGVTSTLEHAGENFRDLFGGGSRWSASAVFIRAVPVRYFLAEDPIDAARTVLMRQVGGAAPAIVAFGIDRLEFDYGVTVGAGSGGRFVFSNDLGAAADLVPGTSEVLFAADPYIGYDLGALRVRLEGSSFAEASAAGRARYALEQTVEFRR